MCITAEQTSLLINVKNAVFAAIFCDLWAESDIWGLESSSFFIGVLVKVGPNKRGKDQSNTA